MVRTFSHEGDDITTKNSNEKYGLEKNERKDKYLNFGEDDQMEIQGFIRSNIRRYTVRIFYVLTLGILRLIFHWYPNLEIIATHCKCSLKNAEKVLITDKYKKFKSYFVKDIKILEANCNGPDINKSARQRRLLEFNLCDGRKKQLYQARIIKCKKLTYIWDDDHDTFVKLAGFDKGIARNELHTFSGQTRDKQELTRIVYGNNEITVPVKTVLTLLALEALTPFYMFQLFSLIVWIAELYFYYTIAIIVMSVVGITTSIIQTRKNQQNLKGTVHSLDTAFVCRGLNHFEQVPSTELVPGDVIMIPSNGCDMQCDAVLLTGNCVVNESMLTGESVPITKNPLPNNLKLYNVKEDVGHTLFCGTKVIQTRVKGDEKVLAVVIRTGYLTTKGELVRSILYPPPADFKFESDSYKFIGILAIIAILGIIYTIVSKSTRNINALDILIKSLDLITIAVPPALPAAMTVGKLYALNRLKNSKIFCINSKVINVSGSIDCVCFDKTGTLTEDELDMWGIVPVKGNKIESPLKEVNTLPTDSSLLRGMATCHSLSVIEDEICGDPLDVKMFESTDWNVEDIYDLNGVDISDDQHHIVVKPKNILQENLSIAIVRQFQFSSHLQRMSVITKSSDTNSYAIYCKGAPETIVSLSTPSSVPENILTELKDYTSQGYRVIALATRRLPGVTIEEVVKLHREDVEADLELVGLIVLENRLKPQTTGVIRTLKEANLKVVMITGDNIQTALHIARECQMVDSDATIIEVVAKEATKYETASVYYSNIHSQSSITNGRSEDFDVEKNPNRRYCFAITGSSWANVIGYFPELVPKIVAKGLVFSRMSGMQKQQLVEEFKNLGYYVAMCGDGANDCGALKAAHVGISLSEAESSVASPFTSKEPNISCMPKVIKEGRAALVTSFGVFKLMLCYSLTEFASVIILYNIDANLSSMQFLFIDICLILNFASFFGITKAYEVLDKVPPMTSLMGFVPISSMVFFMVLTTVYQVVAYYYIQTFDWFEPFIFNENDDKNFVCFENYAIYTVSMFQYITMAIVFSKGKPYRKPLYTNIYFTVSLLLLTVVCIYITVSPAVWLSDLLELKIPPEYNGRYAILVIGLVSFISCIIAEELFVEFILAKLVAPKLRNIDKSKQKYLRVLRDLEGDSTWPTVGDETVILGISEKKSNGVLNNGFTGSQDVLITRC